MHVLHRPHLGGAVAVTAIAAVLAIIFTLAIASNLSGSGSGPATLAAPTGAQASATRPGPSDGLFTRSPFTSLLTAPVKEPWAQNIR
jgi:hypothetical protein